MSVSNLPADQQIHGSVSVSNLPAVTSGVTVIALVTQIALANTSVEWDGVDVSTCRSFSVGVRTLGNAPAFPSNLHIYIWSDIGLGADADVHERDGTPTTGGSSIWGFPTQPGTNEPFYGTSIGLYAKNNDGSPRDMTAAVYCLH